MENMHFTREEREEAIRWAEDSSWVVREDYREDPDYMDCVKDIIDSPVFQSMDDYMQHGDTTCKAHCIKVSYMGYCICRKRGWDYAEVASAGLLHDLFLYDWHTHAARTGDKFHGLTHPDVSYKNASRLYQLNKVEKDIILNHMWPVTFFRFPRTKEGWITTITDKYCGACETSRRK